jgi:acyl-CoA reductase-like NAD-dependent aldehyde dehydrogenase
MSAFVIESRSPQAPDDIVVSATASDREAVDRAVSTARERAKAWAATPASERAGALTGAAAALETVADELAALIVREVGKPVGEARGEVARAVSILRFHGQAALLPDGNTHPTLPPSAPNALTLSRRRPRGVAGLITPWNFPLAIPLWKAAPALAYGNAVVLKPSPEAAATALRLAELLSPFLPAGLLHVLVGGQAAGEQLVERADVISFTGSTAVGRAVARRAAGRGVPVQCEMGGLNSSIVLPDADVEAVARVVAGSAMGYAGQKCTATSRVIIVGDPGPLTEALIAAVDELVVGDPAEPATVVGPVISASSRDTVVQAAAEGGRVLTGGVALPRDGHFVTPTIVDGLAPDARLAREEVFGPIATVLPTSSREEAAALDRAVPYGLVTSVFTEDLGAALSLVDRLETGMIRINQPTSGVDFHTPFGGESGSSIGPREQGLAARALYTTTHTIGIGPPA